MNIEFKKIVTVTDCKSATSGEHLLLKIDFIYNLMEHYKEVQAIEME